MPFAYKKIKILRRVNYLYLPFFLGGILIPFLNYSQSNLKENKWIYEYYKVQKDTLFIFEEDKITPILPFVFESKTRVYYDYPYLIFHLIPFSNGLLYKFNQPIPVNDKFDSLNDTLIFSFRKNLYYSVKQKKFYKPYSDSISLDKKNKNQELIINKKIKIIIRPNIPTEICHYLFPFINEIKGGHLLVTNGYIEDKLVSFKPFNGIDKQYLNLIDNIFSNSNASIDERENTFLNYRPFRYKKPKRVEY